MLKNLQELLQVVTEWIILFTEVIGVGILAYAFIKGLIALFTPIINAKLVLANGFSLSLGFLLGGEILRTVITHDLSDIIIVAALVAIRIALSLLLSREIKEEKEQGKSENNSEI